MGEIKVRNKHVCIGVQNCRHVCRGEGPKCWIEVSPAGPAKEEVRKWAVVCDSTPGWAVCPAGSALQLGSTFSMGSTLR